MRFDDVGEGISHSNRKSLFLVETQLKIGP